MSARTIKYAFEKLTAFALIVAFLAWTVFGPFIFYTPAARAAVSETIAPQGLIGAGQKIKAGSTDVPVIRFQLTGDSATSTVTAVDIVASDSAATGATSTDLTIFKLWRSADNIFDGSDTLVATSTPNASLATSTTLTLFGDTLGTSTAWYIATAATAAGAVDGHGFKFTMPAGAIATNQSGSIGTALASGAVNALTIDTVAPVNTGGGPPNGQQNVPVDAMVDLQFSESLATSSVSTSSVFLKANTGNTQGGAPTGANLCLNFTLQNGSRIMCDHLSDMQPLATSTWYTFSATTTVTDVAGNSIVSATSTVFRTADFSGGNNTTPPFVVSTFPAPGAFDVPTNANLVAEFPLGEAGNMATTGAGSVTSTTNVLLQTVSAGQASGSNICASGGCTLTWNNTARKLTINPASNLAAASDYVLTLKNTITNLAGVPLNGGGPDFLVFFRTGAGADTTPPAVLNTFPATTATGTPATIGADIADLSIQFSEALDVTTVSTSTIEVFKDDGSGGGVANNYLKDGGETALGTASSSIKYLSPEKSVLIVFTDLLDANSRYCAGLTGGSGGLKDANGNALATTTVYCFQTGSAVPDATPPTVLFADADNFGLWVEFDETINAADAVTKSNFSVENPIGVTVNLTNATLTYRPEARAVEIDGIAFQTNQQFKVTVTGVRDRAGNAIVANGSTNVAQGMVLDADSTGGFLGGFDTPDFNQKNFGTFWEKPERCAPRSLIASTTTTLECEFPTPAALATNAKLILTFPAGFDIAGVLAVATSTSFINQDLNGPGPGITTIASVATSTASRTVTLTLNHSGSPMNSGDQLHFELSGVTNPSTTGEKTITIIVKDAAGVKQGQTINPAPFQIFTGGGLSISGRVCKGSTSGGTCGGGDIGISGVKVFLDSFGGFGAGGIMGGHQETTTSATGTYSFLNLTDGQYGVGMFLDMTTVGDVSGGASFNDVTLNGASAANVDFKLVDLSSSGVTLNVNVSGGPASTAMDVFCSAPGDFQFSAPIMKQLTTAGDGTATTSLKLQPNMTYECGLGPHIPFDSFTNGGPPPVPDFTFMPPPPQTVNVGTTTTALSFALLTTNAQIKGKVTDAGGTGIANVFVDAFPAFGKGIASDGSFKDMQGAFAQTKTDGTFTLNVINGTYNIGACAPGMPCSEPVEVTVLDNTGASDNNSSSDVYKNGVLLTGDGLVMKMAKTSTTIAGQVQDENGNGIKYAFVNAEKVNASDTCTSFTPQGGFSGSPTDQQGNYTLYVGDGTWRVNAFAPSYGEVACKIITIAGASTTGQNLKATAGDFGTISGTVTKGGSSTQGAQVTCYGVAGANNSVSGADGSYAMKLKAGTGYTCEGFLQGAGPLTPQTNVTVTAGTSTVVNLSVGTPGTVAVNLGSAITDAFCDARDANGRGDGTGQNNAGVYNLKVPAGTYTLRCGSPKYGELVSTSTVVVAGQTNNISVTSPTLYTVTGRLTDGTSNLEGGTFTFTDKTNGRIIFVQSDGAGGTNSNLSVSLPAGTYEVVASKAGYIDSAAAEELVVAANASTTLRSLVRATAAVSVTVQSASANYTGTARVIATETATGKVATVEVDKSITSGANAALTLGNGTWSVQAFADNGKKSAAATVTVTNNTPDTSALTLNLNTAITGFTAKEANPQSLTPKSGGVFKDANVGTDFEVNIPASVLSTTDSNAGTITTKLDPSLAISTPGKKFIGSAAIDITPKDSSGKAIKDFASNGKAVTIKIPYTDADVAAAGVSESKLVIGAWNEAAQEWETLPTTVDTSNNVLIAQTTHFSDFAPLAPEEGAPATPTGLTASAAGTSQVNLSWTQTSGATGYSIYRDTSAGGVFPRLGSDPTVSSGSTTSYSDTTVAGGTTYFYKITAKNSSGESAASSAVSVSTPAGGGGSSSSGSASSAPASSAPSSQEAAPTEETAPAGTVPATSPTTPPSPAVTPVRLIKAKGDPRVYVVENGRRRYIPSPKAFEAAGYQWGAIEEVALSEVAQLAEITLIRAKGDPRVYVIKNGQKEWIKTPADFVARGYDWKAVTEVSPAAVASYPEISPPGVPRLIRAIGSPRVYVIKNGQKEWIKTPADFVARGYDWKAVTEVSPAAVASYPDAPPAPPLSLLGSELKRNLARGDRGQDVVVLQSLLEAKGFLHIPKGVAKGYFGPLTEEALARFQAQAGITPARGFFGPKTRAYLGQLRAL